FGLRALTFGGAPGTARVDVSTGAEGIGDTIARLGDAAPQFKALAAVFGFLSHAAALPRYRLRGTMQADAGSGLGVTLTLDRRTRSAGGTNLLRSRPATDPSGAETFQMLALVTAGWAEAAVRHDEHLGKFEFEAKEKSYAYLRAGAVYQYLQQPDLAVEAYESAIADDGTNIGA